MLMKTSEELQYIHSRKWAEQSKDIDSGLAEATGQPDGLGQVHNLSGGNNLSIKSLDFRSKNPRFDSGSSAYYCVTLSKPLSEPQLPHLKMEMIIPNLQNYYYKN